MEDIIIKLADHGWNISNGAKGPLAWLPIKDISRGHFDDIKLIIGALRLHECDFTKTFSVELDYPSSDIKKLLLANKMLPSNYNELEMLSKYISYESILG